MALLWLSMTVSMDGYVPPVQLARPDAMTGG